MPLSCLDVEYKVDSCFGHVSGASGCATMMMGHNGGNIVMNRLYMAPFSTSLLPIDSTESQLSIDAMLVKNEEI